MKRGMRAPGLIEVIQKKSVGIMGSLNYLLMIFEVDFSALERTIIKSNRRPCNILRNRLLNS